MKRQTSCVMAQKLHHKLSLSLFPVKEFLKFSLSDLEVSLKCPFRVGPEEGFQLVGKKAKERLELPPVGLTQLNITARWWRAEKMETHTNSVQDCPVHTRRDSAPDGLCVWLRSWRPRGRRVKESSPFKEKSAKLYCASWWFFLLGAG